MMDEPQITIAGEMPRKKVKTVPIKIVQNPNTSGASEAPSKYKKCDLHFQVTHSEQSTNDGGTTNQGGVPSVTIPLQFFQQLMYTALQNKQTTQLLSNQQHLDKMIVTQQAPVYQKTPKLQQNKVYEDLIHQLTVQSKNYQQPIPTEAPQYDPFQLFMESAIHFIIHHKESKNLVQKQFKSNVQLIQYFYNWVNQLKIQKPEDVQLVCSSNLREQSKVEEKVIEFFKATFKEILWEYLRKHAYCDSMRSQQHQQERLEISRQLLLRIQKPGEFYVFN